MLQRNVITEKYRGVEPMKSGSFRAYFGSKPPITIGYFTTALDASIAYDLETLYHYGLGWKTNHPQSSYDQGGEYFDRELTFSSKKRLMPFGVEKTGNIKFKFRVRFCFKGERHCGIKSNLIEDCAKDYDKIARDLGVPTNKLNYPTPQELIELNYHQRELL